LSSFSTKKYLFSFVSIRGGKTMTKTLLVNCFLKTVDKDLLKAVEDFSEVKLVRFQDIDKDYQIDKEIDAVVLSGSYARIVEPADRALFTNVTSLIKTCNLPIFGVCFGHQLLCWTLGAKVGALSQPILDRFENVRVIEADSIFAGFKQGQTIPLVEWHNDYVQKEGLAQAGFALLADSPSCEVEAVKHKTKPFFGVQFHPERITSEHPEGHGVIENFYRCAVKYKKTATSN
jgi:GMP synthase-like glutamine amidotransferase